MAFETTRMVFDEKNNKEYQYDEVGYFDEFNLGEVLLSFINVIVKKETKRLRDMVDFCYNIKNDEKIKNFTPFQRYCIYTHSRDIDCNENEIIKNIKASLDLDLNFEMGIGKLKERTIYAIVEREIKNVNRFVSYSSTTIEGYAFMSLLHLFNTDIIIKKCKNCGEYFIPNLRKDEIYCIDCRDTGANSTWKKSLEECDWKKLHRTIYQSKQMKARRYPDIEKYKKDFKDFQNNYTLKKKELEENKITEEDLIEWLEKQK
jgi:hypothetical protein